MSEELSNREHAAKREKFNLNDFFDFFFLIMPFVFWGIIMQPVTVWQFLVCVLLGFVSVLMLFILGRCMCGVWFFLSHEKYGGK